MGLERIPGRAGADPPKPNRIEVMNDLVKCFLFIGLAVAVLATAEGLVGLAIWFQSRKQQEKEKKENDDLA